MVLKWTIRRDGDHKLKLFQECDTITSVTYILETKSLTIPATAVTFFVETAAGVVCF